MNTNYEGDVLREMEVLEFLARKQRKYAKLFDVLLLGLECSKECPFCHGDVVVGYFYFPSRMEKGIPIEGRYEMEKCRNARMKQAMDPMLLLNSLVRMERMLLQAGGERRFFYEVLFRFSGWGGIVYVARRVWEWMKRRSLPLAPSKGRGKNDACANPEGRGKNGATANAEGGGEAAQGKGEGVTFGAKGERGPGAEEKGKGVENG